jgi:DnaJ domain
MPDPYEIIGVRRDASLDEIRIAYRRSAQVLHPDRFATSSDGVRSEAARRMLQLNGAMEAIEVERADEASGTGTLGSVSFGGGRTPTATASAPSSAPPRPAPPAAAPAEPGGTNGTPPRIASEAPPVAPPKPPVELSRPPAPGQAPAPEPEPSKEPVAETTAAPVDDAEQTQGRELAAFVAPPEEKPDAFDPPPARPVPRAAPAPPPPAAEPEPERPYSLHSEFTFEDDDSEYDDDLPPVSRRARQRGSRSIVPAVIAGVIIVVALAVIAGYFVFGRSGGTGEQTFAKSGAPFTFKYPADFHQRRLDGGVALNKPAFQVGFGLDENNYLLASTYKLGFSVADDGSATGPKGQQLTPDQINHDIDVTIAKLASQAGFTQKGVESGSLGPMRARIYNYEKSDGSLSSTFVVALSGKTEYYVTCQSSPRGEKRIAKACDRLLTTLAPA